MCSTLSAGCLPTRMRPRPQRAEHASSWPMVRFVLLVVLCVLPHVSARTLAPNQAAYAQRVARQAAVRAERAAVSAERLARRAATSAKDALDTDNDGMVSTEELEGSIARLRTRCAGIARRAGRFYAKYRDACTATGGMLGLLHGGKVAYTILCARAFAPTGWPMVRQSVAKIRSQAGDGQHDARLARGVRADGGAAAGDGGGDGGAGGRWR